MKPRLLCWSLLAFSLIALEARAASRSSVLSTDPKLATPITVRLSRAPLCDLAAEVSRKTGVPLTTSEDTADERVTLFARERPAREVLARVAEHFDYSWVAETRNGKRTLVLIQDLAAKRREQALRGGPSRDIAQLRAWVEEQVRQLNSPEVMALRRQPLERRLQRLEELDEALHGTWVQTENGKSRAPSTIPRERREALEVEQRRLQRATPEGLRFNFTTICQVSYQALPAPVREALWDGDLVTLSYPAEEGRVPLSREQAASLVAGGLTQLYSREEPGTLRESHPRFHEVERVRVRLELKTQGTETVLGVRLRTVGSTQYDGAAPRRVEWTFQEDVQPRYFRDEPRSAEPLDTACRRLTQRLILEPAPSKPRSGLPDEPETRFEQVLEQLATRTAYPILADAYYSGALDGPLIRGEAPLAQILERINRVFHRTCRLSGGYLLFRHEDWATRRAMEPPARAVRRWEEHIRRYGALRFADLIEISGRLTPEQVEIFQAMLGATGPPGLASRLGSDQRDSGAVLRLLYEMPPPQRKALEGGQEVPVRALPARSARHLARVFLTAADGISGHEDFDYPGGPFKIGAGFAREDQLQALWPQSRLRLHRKPQKWVFTTLGCRLVNTEEDERRVIQEERLIDPQSKPRVLQGELVEVTFLVPGVEPVTHWFLEPTQELRPAPLTRP